ncbi:MAG TPA: hypothetical protein QF683_04105, partial [SAR324 cluster bacterium]|nr:hypothetical protein [SAR324 cluster bacterium]
YEANIERAFAKKTSVFDSRVEGHKEKISTDSTGLGMSSPASYTIIKFGIFSLFLKCSSNFFWLLLSFRW